MRNRRLFDLARLGQRHSPCKAQSYYPYVSPVFLALRRIANSTLHSSMPSWLIASQNSHALRGGVLRYGVVGAEPNQASAYALSTDSRPLGRGAIMRQSAFRLPAQTGSRAPHRCLTGGYTLSGFHELHRNVPESAAGRGRVGASPGSVAIESRRFRSVCVIPIPTSAMPAYPLTSGDCDIPQTPRTTLATARARVHKSWTMRQSSTAINASIGGWIQRFP